MKHKILVVIALIAFTALGVSTFTHRENKIQFQEVQLQSKQAEIKQLELDYQLLNKKQDTIQKDHSATKEQIEQLQKEKDDLLKRQQELEQKLSLKLEAKKLAAEKLNAASTASVVASAAGSCNTGNQYKDYIYMKESSCNPAAVNSIGCRGIAQACPGEKLPCSSSDFDCQDRWFTQYAMNRYGSWEAAYAFWLNNHWW